MPRNSRSTSAHLRATNSSGSRHSYQSLVENKTEPVRGASEAWQPCDQRSAAGWAANSCRMAPSAYCARELLSYGATVAHPPVGSTNVMAFARRGRSLHYLIRGRTTSSYCVRADQRSEPTVRGGWLCHEREANRAASCDRPSSSLNRKERPCAASYTHHPRRQVQRI